MADSATRAQRAAALEEKRRKLEELKKSRSRRSEDAQRVKVTTSANLDEYIDGLLMSTATTMTPAAAAAASTAEAASTDGGKGSVPELVDETTRQESSLAAVASFGPSTSSLASNAGAEPAAGPPPPVTCFVETFSVATQTEEDDFPEPSPSPSSDDAALLDLDDAEDDKAAQNGGKDGGQRGTTGSGRIESGSDGTEVAAFDPKLLSPDQVQKEVSTGTFSSFLNTASKKVERVLGTPLLADLMVELGADDAATTRAPNLEGGDHDSLFRRFVSSRIVLQCPRWTSRRDVTDLDWSPFHREMILTTHHSPTSRSMAVSMFGTSPVVQPPAAATSPADGALALSSPASVLTSSLVPRRGELESAGLACVWSLAMPGRPEHVFTAGSPVTSGRFHPSDSSLIVGGLESGQLVVWDVRAGRLPVQKSALASTTVALSSSSTPASSSATKCHTYPLTGMEIIEGGLGLATSSTDGRLNFWSFASLREPVETLRVGDSVSCFTVLPETGGILAADDHGGLYLVGAAAAATTGGATVGGSSSSQSTSASKSAVAVTSAASSSRKLVRKLVADENNSMNSNYSTNSGVASHHFGMVTSLSAKIFKGSASAAAYSRTSTGLLRGSGGLVLSTGVDWTTKLWAPAYGGPAASSAAPASTSNQRQEVSPLWSATSHSYDYMSDVKWSPVHPGLFATACSNGTLGLWNLASSLDEPLTGAAGLSLMGDSSDATIAAAAESSTAGAKQNRGLNKIRWSGDGRRLAVASGDVLHVLTVQEDVARPKGDEDDKIMNQLVSRGLITRQ